MKKGDKPKDLSQAWWSKNKATTLKSTGLGKALGEYEKVRAGTPSLKYYQDCLKALNKLPAAVAKAEKACNAKLHKETLDALGGYKAVISKEAQEVAKEDTDYAKKLSIFKQSREKLIKTLSAALKKTSETYELGNSGLDKLKGAVEKKDVALAAKLKVAITTAAQSVEKQVAEAIKECAPWRTGEAPYSQPGLNADDRESAGGSKTLETINPMMVKFGDLKTDASRLPAAVQELMKKLG